MEAYPPQTTTGDVAKNHKLLLIFFVLFVILAMVFFILFLTYFSRVESRNANIWQSPYCLRMRCSDGKDPVPMTFENDKQKQVYSTINYCTINSPPEPFAAAVAQCANKNVPFSGSEAELFKEFIPFYTDQYIPACGYTWKSATVPANQPQNGVNDPNDPATLNGANDELISLTYRCATQTMGWTSTEIPALETLKTKCGAPCA
jgi:hypothetical protein